MSKIIQEQLKNVLNADISQYDEKTCTYFIPKKTTIKLEENGCYLLEIKSNAFTNADVVSN